MQSLDGFVVNLVWYVVIVIHFKYKEMKNLKFEF
jgi:hypothetical protein